MSAGKTGFNPWIATVILGVITILFSLYALQSQTELVTERKLVEKLKNELLECKKSREEEAKKSQARLESALNDAKVAQKEAEENYRKLRKK